MKDNKKKIKMVKKHLKGDMKMFEKEEEEDEKLLKKLKSNKKSKKRK
jgi:hypothetical protein